MYVCPYTHLRDENLCTCMYVCPYTHLRDENLGLKIDTPKVTKTTDFESATAALVKPEDPATEAEPGVEPAEPGTGDEGPEETGLEPPSEDAPHPMAVHLPGEVRTYSWH